MKGVAQTDGLDFALCARESKGKTKVVGVVYRALISALLFSGVAGSIATLFLPDVSVAVLAPVGLAASVLIYVCFANKKLRLPGLIFLALFIAVWSVLLWNDMGNGLNLVATQVGDVLGESFGRIFPIFEVGVAQEEYGLSITLFLVPLCLILALLCSFLVFTSSAVLVLVVAATLFAITIVLNQMPAVLSSLALIVAMLLVASASFDTRSYYQGRFSKGSLQTSVGLLLLSFVAVATLWLMATPDDYEPPAVIAVAQSTTQRVIDNARYSVDTSLGMPDGDFVDLGSLDLSEDTALKVTMEKPDSLWLRGYVGSVYTGTGWDKDDPKESYSYRDLFYWLHEEGFFGQTQLADAAAATGVLGQGESSRVMVDNLGASSRNIYAPYETFWADEVLLPTDGIGDTSFYAEGLTGTRNYSYSVVPNQVKQFPQIMSVFSRLSEEPGERADSFLAVEGYYAAYVSERYLEVDPDLSLLLNSMLPQGEASLSFSDAKQAILDVLTEKVSYSETIIPTQQTDDFIASFLATTQEGYSIHYASAGTVMFRHLGFPARYVEGYLITPSDVEGLQENSVLTLDGTHAHAWTEVYLDGVGWIPVELTPPYLDVMEQADTLRGVSATNNSPDDSSSDDTGAPETDPSVLDDKSNAEVKIDNTNALWWFVIAGALLVIIAVLVLILYRVFKRRRVLRNRAQVFDDHDYARAITAMYHYCMNILGELGMESTEVLRLPLLLPSAEHFLPSQTEGFGRVFNLYEEAAYSKHTMSVEQRDEMAAYTDDLAQVLKENSRGLQSLRVKLLLCLL